MAALLQDFRFALRSLGRSPAFTLVAVVTLALGIGANTAIFSVLYGVLLRPLPYPEPYRLVQLAQRYRDGENEMYVTWNQFRFLRDHVTGMEGIAGTTTVGFNMVTDAGAVRAFGQRVSANYFGVLGVPPALGRGFLDDEDRPGGPNAVVLSHGFWQRAFGGDPAVVGRTVPLDGAPHVVVGVMPAGFRSIPTVDAWSTLAQVGGTIGSGQNLRMLARLSPGVSLSEARARLPSTVAGFRESFEGWVSKEAAIELQPYHRLMVLDLARPVRILVGAIAFVLLIACANVASLVLGRSVSRSRELALRHALGAGRGRLLRQLLTESVVLGLVGGALGLLCAVWGLQALLAFLPADVPRAADIGLDGSALGFTLGLSLLVGVAVGLLPALRAGKAAVTDALNEGSGRLTSGARQGELRNALVAGQLALALVLLAGAGLLIRTFSNLLSTDPGFVPDRVVSAEIWLTGTRYESTAATSDFYRRVIAELEGSPGVERAAVVEAGLPLDRGGNLQVTVDDNADPRSVDYRAVTPSYFDVLGVPLRAGRLLASSDVEGGEPVALVNEIFARQLLGSGSPVGRMITVGGGEGVRRRVVGVVADVRSYIGLPAPPTVFLSSAQTPQSYTRIFSSWFPIHVVVRARGDAAPLTDVLTTAIRRSDGQVPVGRVRPLTEVLAETLALQRFIMLLLGAFAGLALLLAAVGVYGLMSYVVIQRRQEIGVRLALGALPGDVLRLVLGRGLRLTLVGVALGLSGAALLTRLLANQLYGVEPLDPGTFAAGTAGLALVTLAACCVPALRAARVDPAIVLKGR